MRSVMQIYRISGFVATQRSHICFERLFRSYQYYISDLQKKMVNFGKIIPIDKNTRKSSSFMLKSLFISALYYSFSDLRNFYSPFTTWLQIRLIEVQYWLIFEHGAKFVSDFFFHFSDFY